MAFTETKPHFSRLPYNTLESVYKASYCNTLMNIDVKLSCHGSHLD